MNNILENLRYIEGRDFYPRMPHFDRVEGQVGFVRDHAIDLFGTNDYLGLSQRQEVWQAAMEAIPRFGLGARATRAVGGAFSVIAEFEERLGRFLGKEDAVTFSSGAQANSAAISALANFVMVDKAQHYVEEPMFFMDQLAHASLYDAVKLSGAPSKIFPHNHTAILARTLSRSEIRRKIIIVDGLYSAEADVAPLDEIVEIAERFDAMVYLDDAHGVGSLGPRCGGTADLFGLAGHPRLIIAGTLSKTFGGIGGFVSGSRDFCRWARIACRPSLFSHSLPPNLVCGFLKALEILDSEGPELQRKMRHNVELVRNGLKALGIEPLGSNQVPIIPVVIGDESDSINAGSALLERGIHAPNFPYPSVPQGQARLRLTVTSIHKPQQIARLISAFGKVVREMNLQDKMPRRAN